MPALLYRSAKSGAALVYRSSAYSGGVPAPAYATYINETFESVAGAPRANLSGMRWYVWAQVAPAPLGAPIAQGVAETTDGAGVSLIDISGQTSVAPGAIVTLGFTNSNGDPAQADLMSWFGAVVAH